MNRTIRTITLAFVAMSSAVIAVPAAAQSFSTGSGVTDVSFGTPAANDILGPAGVSPVVAPTVLLSGGGAGPDLHSFSFGRSGTIGTDVYFSIDGYSGAATSGDSGIENLVSDANTDIFVTHTTVSPGTNTQVHDGDGLQPVGCAACKTNAPLGILEPAYFGGGTFRTGVDAYDTRTAPAGPNVYFTLNPFFTPNPPLTGILISPATHGFAGAGTRYASPAALGIGDDDLIDALEVYDAGAIGVYDAGDRVLFSLDPRSPFLTSSPYTRGDILIASFDVAGPPSLHLSHAVLGLNSGDNLDALSVAAPIPVPGVAVLFAAVSSMLLMRDRRNP